MPASRVGWRARVPELHTAAMKLRLNRIPQRLIHDRRVFAGMGSAVVDDFAAIGGLLLLVIRPAWLPMSSPAAVL